MDDFFHEVMKEVIFFGSLQVNVGRQEPVFRIVDAGKKGRQLVKEGRLADTPFAVDHDAVVVQRIDDALHQFVAPKEHIGVAHGLATDIGIIAALYRIDGPAPVLDDFVTDIAETQQRGCAQQDQGPKDAFVDLAQDRHVHGSRWWRNKESLRGDRRIIEGEIPGKNLHGTGPQFHGLQDDFATRGFLPAAAFTRAIEEINPFLRRLKIAVTQLEFCRLCTDERRHAVRQFSGGNRINPNPRR